MTTIDLCKIRKDPCEMRDIVRWVCDEYGPPDYRTWTIKGLRYITFTNDKHATYFTLRFS